MKQHNILFALMASFMLVNCSEDIEKQAQYYLTRAQQSYQQQQYALAKLQIDSIKLMYPKAFNTRSQAQKLFVEVSLAETRASKVYIDSLLIATKVKAQPQIAALYFDKDSHYQDMGTYYASRHRTEKNVGKSYLRPQTDERGHFTLTAFYRGRPMGTHTLRLSAPDKSYIDLHSITDPYVMSDATGHTERTDFAATPELTHFAISHTSLTATLIGTERRVILPFSKTDLQALVQVGELASTLQSLTSLQTQQEEHARRITFYEEKQE